MRLREIDAGGWLRAVGAALFGGSMAAVFTTRFTDALPTVVLVGVVVAIAVLVLVAVAWASGGGPAEQRALRDWVRGGPEPDTVRRDRKARFLRDFVDRTGWYLWLGAALAVVFAAGGISDLVGKPDVSSAVLSLATAAVWVVVSVRAFVVERPHRARAALLYAGLVTSSE